MEEWSIEGCELFVSLGFGYSLGLDNWESDAAFLVEFLSLNGVSWWWKTRLFEESSLRFNLSLSTRIQWQWNASRYHSLSSCRDKIRDLASNKNAFGTSNDDFVEGFILYFLSCFFRAFFYAKHNAENSTIFNFYKYELEVPWSTILQSILYIYCSLHC